MVVYPGMMPITRSSLKQTVFPMDAGCLLTLTIRHALQESIWQHLKRTKLFKFLIQQEIMPRPAFVAEVQEAVGERVELPAGWRLEWGGQFYFRIDNAHKDGTLWKKIHRTPEHQGGVQYILGGDVMRYVNDVDIGID